MQKQNSKNNTPSSGKKLNKELQKEVDGLRGSILGAAEKQSLTERFLIKDNPIEGCSKMIVDTETGKETCVPLFALREVKEALDKLFG